MDGFELNKIFGAVTGMFGAYLAIMIGSEMIYEPTHPSSADGHGGGLAYALAIEGADDHGGDEPAATFSLAALIAEASPDAGARVFNKCKSCHNVEEGGANGIGPNLWGVVGADIGHHAGFAYSDALLGKDGVWDWEQLSAFLENPKGWAPGTKMGFAGLSKPEERAAVMVYLNAQSSTPLAPLVE